MIKLSPELVTSEKFREFGEVIYPCDNRRPFSEELDLNLDIKRGDPRLYIMQLLFHGLSFKKISRHINCSQCLGSMDSKNWYLAVCPPNDESEIPDLDKLKLFEIPQNCIIKIEAGTWHEGPYFTHQSVNFLNLEHQDTILNDYYTCNLDETYFLDIENK